MANAISHAALPFPVKGARFSVLVPYLDADGDPTDPTTPDTEISTDAGAFADAAEEVTTISGSNGMGYITLSGAETNGSVVALAAKVASGPKATLATLYPRVLPAVRSGTAQAGAAGTITLDSGAAAIDDYYNGCIIKTTGGTGGGGTGGANNQARVITDYVGSTKVATISPNWETNPSSDTTFDVLLTECSLLRYGDLQAWRGSQPNALSSGRVDATVGAMQADVVTAAAIATGAIDADAIADNAIDAGAIANDAITAAKIATGAIDADAIADGAIDAGAIAADAITAAKIADGAIDAATFAAGAINAAAIATDAITAAKIAADAIGASELAADAVSEIQSGLATSSALSTAQADLDDIQTRLPAALVSGRMDSSVGAMAAGVVTAAAVATNAIDADALATDAVSEIQAAVAAGAVASVTGAVGSVTGNVGGNVAGSVGSVVGAVGSVTGAVGSVGANGINAASLDPDVTTELQSGLATAAALSTVAGYLDTEITSILTAVTNILAAVDTEVAAILADTNELQTDWADGGRLDLLVDAILARLPALVGGRIDASVGAMAADVITASALSAGAVDEIHDEQIGDGTITHRQALRVLIAGMAGKLSGAATTTATVRNLADSADVIVATVDASGNRSAVTVTP